MLQNQGGGSVLAATNRNAPENEEVHARRGLAPDVVELVLQVFAKLDVTFGDDPFRRRRQGRNAGGLVTTLVIVRCDGGHGACCAFARPLFVILGTRAQDVEIGLLYLIFLHDTCRGGERALAGFVPGALVGVGYLFAFRHADGDGKAEIDVLRAGRAPAENRG